MKTDARPFWQKSCAIVLVIAACSLTVICGVTSARWIGVVFPGFFLILLLDELRRSRRALAVGLLGAVIAAGLLLALPPGPALIGSAAAALLGLLALRKASS